MVICIKQVNIIFMEHKNLMPRNDMGLAHGYWEFHWFLRRLHFKGHFIKNERIGYWVLIELATDKEVRSFYAR